MKTFNEKYGPWVLVTGASSGIGAVFTKEVATKGLNTEEVVRKCDSPQYLL